MSLGSQILAKMAQNRGFIKNPEKFAQATEIIKNADRNMTGALSQLNSLGNLGKDTKRNERKYDVMRNFETGLFGNSRLKFDRSLRNFLKANATGIEKEFQETMYAGFYSFFKDITADIDPKYRDEAIINYLGLEEGDIESAYRIWVDANEDFVNEIIDYYLGQSSTDKLLDNDGNPQDLPSPPNFRATSVLLPDNKRKIANAKRKNTWRLKRLKNNE